MYKKHYHSRSIFETSRSAPLRVMLVGRNKGVGASEAVNYSKWIVINGPTKPQTVRVREEKKWKTWQTKHENEVW